MILAWWIVAALPALGAEKQSTLLIAADDLAVLQRIAQREKLTASPEVVTKGWPLEKGETGLRFASLENPRHVLTVVTDHQKRVIKYLGNGPLLSNASLADVAQLLELRVIRIDHNTPGPNTPQSRDDYDGSAFDHLANSKLEELKIGHAFNDRGLHAVAKIRGLKNLNLVHSGVTDQGIKALEKHPHLEIFHIASQARPERITDKSLPVLATLPKLRELGLHETFLTYEGGLKHLQEAKALEMLSVKLSLVLPADLDKLRKDLPKLTIESSSPAEILAHPNNRGLQRWASPAALAYLKSGELKN